MKNERNLVAKSFRLAFASLILISIMTIVLNSCFTQNVREAKATPNMDLALEFGVDTSDLIYQYYQKYGFTDLCEDLRMVSFVETSPKLKKKLPISEDDLNVINAFSNKVDSVNNSAITFETNTRIFFLDIELDFIEFVTDSTLEVGIKEGEYEIVQDKLSSILKVYDSQKGLFYIEIHECDGT